MSKRERERERERESFILVIFQMKRLNEKKTCPSAKSRLLLLSVWDEAQHVRDVFTACALCVSLQTHTHKHILVHGCDHTHTHTHTHTNTHTNTYSCTDVITHVHTNTYSCTDVITHTHTHKHILVHGCDHTRTHKHILVHGCDLTHTTLLYSSQCLNHSREGNLSKSCVPPGPDNATLSREQTATTWDHVLYVCICVCVCVCVCVCRRDPITQSSFSRRSNKLLYQCTPLSKPSRSGSIR